jgi:hypothetical protein
LSAIWGSGPDDVWMLGGAVTRHWDGKAWTPMSTVTALIPLEGVWGSASNDVWIVGIGGAILHRVLP